MDRYLAWLIADEKLNLETEVPTILKPAHTKFVAMGFIAAVLVMMFLASLGYVVYD